MGMREERGGTVEAGDEKVVVQLEKAVVLRSRRWRVGDRVEPVIELVAHQSEDRVAVPIGRAEVNFVQDYAVETTEKDHLMEEHVGVLRQSSAFRQFC
jgi:hypothetical protein